MIGIQKWNIGCIKLQNRNRCDGKQTEQYGIQTEDYPCLCEAAHEKKHNNKRNETERKRRIDIHIKSIL